MANLFSVGDTELMTEKLKKLMAIRIYRRYKTVGDISKEKSDRALAEVNLSEEDAEGLYRLTSLAKFDERFVIPAAHREQAIEMAESTADVKGSTGMGFREPPVRGL